MFHLASNDFDTYMPSPSSSCLNLPGRNRIFHLASEDHNISDLDLPFLLSACRWHNGKLNLAC